MYLKNIPKALVHSSSPRKYKIKVGVSHSLRGSRDQSVTSARLRPQNLRSQTKARKRCIWATRRHPWSQNLEISLIDGAVYDFIVQFFLSVEMHFCAFGMVWVFMTPNFAAYVSIPRTLYGKTYRNKQDSIWQYRTLSMSIGQYWLVPHHRMSFQIHSMSLPSKKYFRRIT
jgi:hypothetical protein